MQRQHGNGMATVASDRLGRQADYYRKPARSYYTPDAHSTHLAASAIILGACVSLQACFKNFLHLQFKSQQYIS